MTPRAEAPHLSPARLSRRHVLAAGAAASLSPLLATTAKAQSYPTRSVRVVVSAAAGLAPDLLARHAGQWLTDRLGQSFVIEPRPGGAGNIGNETVVRAAPDGYTLLLVDGSGPINTSLYDNLSFNFLRDIAPVVAVMNIFYVWAVHPSVPANTLQEFIRYAKANPGKINMASPAVGSGPHVTGELLKMMAGIDMVHVPYRGGGGMYADLISGQVQAFMGTPISAIEHIRAGKLRALAVTSAQRWDLMPDLPAIGEIVPGYEGTSVYGLGAPRDTPPAIINTLNATINDALRDPQIRKRVIDLGGIPAGGSPADFGKILVDATHKWEKVIRTAHIKPE
jgi:tripartite-type tricarboxylate transporter receptor subunit TctC